MRKHKLNIKYLILTLFIFLLALLASFTSTFAIHLILNDNKINNKLNNNKEYYDKVEKVGQYKDFDHTPLVRFKYLGDWTIRNNVSKIGYNDVVNKSKVAMDQMKKGDKITYIKVKDVWSNRERIIIKKVE